MSKVCDMCGKQKVSGGSITRKGMAKKDGGIGMHVVKNWKRMFHPNLQSIRIQTPTGVKRIKICAACLREGNFVKAVEK